jgi:hypothetical protein
MSLVNAQKKMSSHFKSIGIQCVFGEHHFCEWVTGWYHENQLQLLPVMFLLMPVVVIVNDVSCLSQFHSLQPSLVF